ncbi:hypothetical protein FHT44_002377 [Mycolicibacterium sp. BK634]|uniref:hypothetical protein n=1 Tax=Mycolicibacterium sp. BK634 TaxID=2587099 RepID=UPI0016165C1D|nr:hypothetical protein [Mycolicibacterium sp. BK634]MBB3749916.1 hypothetical protein [Mycolicibacterium sp. BK634]
MLEPVRSKRRWLVPAGVGIAVVVAAVGATLLTLRWSGDKPMSAPQPVTVTSIAPPPPSPSSQHSSTQMAEADVKSSMQKKLDSFKELASLKLTVVDVMLVHKGGNEFKGIAHIRGRDGVVHDVPVDVTSDESTTMWEAPPGWLDFAEVKPPPPIAAPPPASSPAETFKICPSGLSGVASDDTSCAFADNVRASWYASPGSAINAYSPVTSQSYLMRCLLTATDVWPRAQRCAGTNAQGTVLVVYFN